MNSSSIGWSWIYGAMIVACCWRYSVNVSLDQQPKAFMTSNGTPPSRNSRVPPIQMPWPLRLSSPSSSAIMLILSKKTFFVNGHLPLACLYAKRGSLILKWLLSVVLGSETPWCDQNTSSPSNVHLAFGIWKTVTSKLLWSYHLDISDGLTCHAGLKAFRVGSVNSSVWATE